MHAIAHRGCTDTVRESSALEDDSEKNLSPHRGLEPALISHTWAFIRMLYQLGYFPPLLDTVL